MDSSDQCSTTHVYRALFCPSTTKLDRRVNEKGLPHLCHTSIYRASFFRSRDGIKLTSSRSVFYFHNRSAVSPRSSPNRYKCSVQTVGRQVRSRTPGVFFLDQRPSLYPLVVSCFFYYSDCNRISRRYDVCGDVCIIDAFTIKKLTAT